MRDLTQHNSERLSQNGDPAVGVWLWQLPVLYSEGGALTSSASALAS